MVLVHDTLSHCAVKCMKFRPNRFISVQLTERTQNCIQLCYKVNNLKNEHALAMLHVHDMSPDGALKMYEVSF